MSSGGRVYLGLDVGERRIGLALSQGGMRIAWPLSTIENSGDIDKALAAAIQDNGVTDLVVGRPRNQAGEPTAQTRVVEKFVKEHLEGRATIHWQDESATSVLAEQRIAARQKNYQKSEIDAEAAAIILQDYLEANL